MPVTHYLKGRDDGPSDVFIATPSTDAPRPNYTVSLAETMAGLPRHGLAADYCLHVGDCHVDDARNTLLRQFLISGCGRMIFIDADVGWRIEDFLFMARIDRDVVAGVYPMKQDDTDFPVRVPAGSALWSDRDGLVEVEGAPTGFMMITRAAVEAMVEKNRHRRFWARGVSHDDPPHTVVFERSFGAEGRMSGDYNFCREWRGLGGKVFVAPEMVFSHDGAKSWQGSLGSFWRRKHKVPDPRIMASIGAIRSGTAAPESFVDLWAVHDNPFAAGPTMLAAVHALALAAKGPVLETGSGLTTLVMGLAADAAGIEVHSLEHDLDWLGEAQRLLDAAGVRSVRLHYAPLQPAADGRAWYTAPPLPSDFALVVCDGPPRRFGRSTLFERFGDRMRNAVIVADDADDPAELALVLEWAGATGREVSVVGSAGARQFALSRPPAAPAA